ncbi:hypothetical protein QQZ08_000906 [Neonectria magnoliae]|uniref:Fibronectin type III-like domain-containing protein n=1 Tax=Neonectria magnoliae TaxID=2732573 RepID=A0ABR1IGB8_9HYPO
MFPLLISSVDNENVAKLIDEAVFNLPTLKFATGAFDNALPDEANVNKALRASSHLNLARQAARESVVLLQNDSILSKTPKKVALLDPFGELLNFGSYGAINVSNPKWGDSLHTSLKSVLDKESVQFAPGVDRLDITDESGIYKAVAAAKDAGFAVLMLVSLSTPMEDPLFKKRTDDEFFAHADLGFPGLQQKLLDAVPDMGVPTVLILTGGQPFVLTNPTLRSNAILQSLLGSEYRKGNVIINVKVRNTGDVVGKEIVQMYHRPNTTIGIEFPVRRHVRFEKVELEAGESKDVTFSIPHKDFGVMSMRSSGLRKASTTSGLVRVPGLKI